jgi:homopolymeric O-antigen transport system permease protein
LRDTFWVLVAKDFKARYRAQNLGLFWSLAHPLVMMVTLTVAFQWVLKVQIPNFPIFYLIGAVFWQLFSNVLPQTAGSILDNGGLIKHTTFPRFLFPVATVFSNLIPFGLELFLVFAFFPVFPSAYHLNETLVALPLIVLLFLVLLVGAGLMTSALNARYRDVFYLVTSVLTVGFWATPVLYSTEMAPPWLRPFLRLNPIACVIEGARDIIMRGQWPSATYLGAATLEAVVVFVIGASIFRRQARHVADYV